MVQIRFAAGSIATGGRSRKPFSLALRGRQEGLNVALSLFIYILYILEVFFMRLSNLLGLCLLVPGSGGSIRSSEESGEDARVVLSRRCSCWDKY